MRFVVAGSSAPVEFVPQALVIAGFTGRNREGVARHIAELRAEGIVAPEVTPVFYPLPPSLLTDASTIDVASPHTSGEAEPVLLCGGSEWYVAVGSDHTARDLERIDIHLSKAACPKIVSAEVWRYGDLRGHWDDIALRSWTRSDPRALYQEGRLADLMPIEEILAAMRAAGLDSQNTAVFLGTLPLLTSGFVYADRYEVELLDPVRGRSLRRTYSVVVRRGADG